MRKRTEYDKTYDKERYQWLKEYHICVRCKKEKAEKGKLYCLVCKMDRREMDRKRQLNTEQRERNRIHKKRRYDILVAFGICPRCGIRKHKKNSIFCGICSVIRNKKEMEKRRERGVTARVLFGSEGYCSVCGKPTESGKKQCKRCLENSRRTIKIALQKSLETENPFRKQIINEFRIRRVIKNDK